MSKTTATLDSVFFLNQRQGWAVGLAGTIMMTLDGGVSWFLRVSNVKWSLLSVTFANARQGWAVGMFGEIATTGDGGAHWASQTSGVSNWLWSVAFANARQGWAVGENGTIIATSDGGAHWLLQSSEVSNWLWSVAFTDARHGWAAGEDGSILTTTDGGAHWAAQTGPVFTTVFKSVAFTDAQHGWAVGNAGTIVATSDGGAHWAAQSRGVIGPLNSVAFADGQHGWAVGRSGTLIATSDGGAHWAAQSNWVIGYPVIGPLNSVTFAAGRHGWVVGYGGIIALGDGGAHWVAQSGAVTEPLNSVAFADAQHGWAVGDGFFVGDGGTIVATSDGGAHWAAQTSGVKTGLNSVAFADAQHGWAVGTSGTIVATSDGGAHWAAQSSGVNADLNSVAFANAQRGWAVGEKGRIIATNDGGAHWASPLAPYRVYPPPWFWLSVVLVGLLAARGLRRPLPIAESDSIADRLISDKPLADGEFDALNLHAVAEGLSRFFRNRNTVPPMTVAVIGDWGYGKSSLMRLLEADLCKHRVRPVWFNAWHHQTEEQLLAYLIEAIRIQAIPPIITPTGLRFRLRLLWIRAKTYWAVILACGGIAGFCAGLIVRYGVDISSLEAAVKAWVGNLATAVTLITGFFGLRELLKPFGVSPASLLRKAQEGTRIRALEIKTSFRMAFASQFHEVTEALDPYQMVIFIDDLDRCQPDRVLQVLEATNFLASAGDCFIVLGMARKMVLASVGLAFERIAAEVAAVQQPGPDGAVTARREYAQNYLSKLLNLEVTIRRQNVEQVRSMVEHRDKRPLASPAERLTAWGRRNAYFLLGLAIAGASGSFWAAKSITIPSATPRATASAAPTAAPTASIKPVETRPPVPAAISTVGASVAESEFRPGAPPTVRDWWYVLFALAGLPLLLAGAVLLFRRPDSVTDDSPRFREALEIWSDVLAANYRSPREVKRFMNFVRYLAMRARVPEAQLTPLERVINWVARAEPKGDATVAVQNNIGEAAIVCMALLKRPISDNETKTLMDKSLAEALKEHQERFGLPSAKEWAWYDDIVGEVSVNGGSAAEAPAHTGSVEVANGVATDGVAAAVDEERQSRTSRS